MALKHIINATTSLNATEIHLSIATALTFVYFEQGQWSIEEEPNVVMEKKLVRSPHTLEHGKSCGYLHTHTRSTIMMQSGGDQEDHPHATLSMASLATYSQGRRMMQRSSR